MKKGLLLLYVTVAFVLTSCAEMLGTRDIHTIVSHEWVLRGVYLYEELFYISTGYSNTNENITNYIKAYDNETNLHPSNFTYSLLLSTNGYAEKRWYSSNVITNTVVGTWILDEISKKVTVNLKSTNYIFAYELDSETGWMKFTSGQWTYGETNGLYFDPYPTPVTNFPLSSVLEGTNTISLTSYYEFRAPD